MTLKLHKNNASLARQKFERVRSHLAPILGSRVMIEHVGSTALPDVDGKGIIDVMIAYPSPRDLPVIVDLLSKNGYFAARDAAEHTERVFMASRLEDTVEGDIHLHIVRAGSLAAKQFIAVREYFLSHPADAREYSETKHAIAAASHYEREEYKKRKSEFMKKILEKIASETTR